MAELLVLGSQTASKTGVMPKHGDSLGTSNFSSRACSILGSKLWSGVFLFLFSVHGGAAQVLGSEKEIQALLEFKASIKKDPEGSMAKWSNKTSPCIWYGVSCNAQGSVISLNLSGKNLSGTISDSLTNLLSLSTLNLSSNSLTGALPSSLCAYNVSSLTILSLENNQLTGTIPASFGNCTNLVYLSLYSNYISGSIDSQLGMLSRLQYLALSFNQLTGPLPTSILANCTQLSTLAFSVNNLTGPLPPEIGKLTYLQYLWADQNMLSEAIPYEIGNLTNLTVLELNDNELVGSIPASIGQLRSLSLVLSLSMNRLTGRIPAELGNLINLGILTLMGNSLTGAIPKELGNMQSLQGLFLEDNMLEGPIPQELSRCSHLQRIRLYNNRLNGSIPGNLGSLQGLTELYLHQNALEGGIPPDFKNFSGIQDLSLGYNNLSGHIPDQVAGLSTIIFNFSMPHNLLNGSIPDTIGQMIHVQNIDLSLNNLSGVIPSSIGHCGNLVNLNLSHNSLTGGITDTFSGLQLLESLDLSYNSLSGTIPTLLAALPNLKHVNLSFNNFTGKIPTAGVFATLNSSSFLSNPGLCGAPLTVMCISVPITKQNGSGLPVVFKVLIILGSIFVFIFCIFLIRYILCVRCKGRETETSARLWICYKHSKSEASTVLSPSGFMYRKHLKQFTVLELESVTNKFDDACIIGSGATSTVYKGTKLAFGDASSMRQVDVAIKVLAPKRQLTFSAELEMLGSIRHRNLVCIYGYCDSMEVRALVLELLPKGSLQDQLHSKGPTHLTLIRRMQIALDVAQGLSYLHHGLKKQIVHRDVKPSNILLDENWVAKISDFGISKHIDLDEVDSQVRGTLGYVAPEYAESTRVDIKGDVYSYGIVVLEMLTGREPTDHMFGNMGISMPNWVKECYPERYHEVIDPELGECNNGLQHSMQEVDEVEKAEEAVKMLIEMALMCVREKSEQRPDMNTIVTCLVSIESVLLKTQNSNGRQS